MSALWYFDDILPIVASSALEMQQNTYNLSNQKQDLQHDICTIYSMCHSAKWKLEKEWGN